MYMTASSRSSSSSVGSTCRRSALGELGSAAEYQGDQRPVRETKELVAGFSIWQVASMDEAVEWVKRSPFRDGEIELRKVLDAEDFSDSFPAGIAAAEQRMRAESPVEH
jgi:hypothetical protein